MTFDNLRVTIEGAVALVTIDRPAVRNALDAVTLDELQRAFLGIKQTDSLRVAILTGAGDQAFVAGADINELTRLTPAGARDQARLGQGIFDLIDTLGKPVIAAINGWALGGGCELAMACTLRLASENARLGQPEIGLGLIPGYGGTQRLPRLVGRGRALEMLLTGGPVTAAEAERMGLVNRVVPAAALLDEAKALANRLAAQPPVAMAAILDAVRRGLDGSLDEGLAHEAALFGLMTATDDMREGTRAFLEKRKPVFGGK